MEERIEDLKVDPDVPWLESAWLRRSLGKFRKMKREKKAIIADGFKGLLKNKPRDLTAERVFKIRGQLRMIKSEVISWEKTCAAALTLKNDKDERAFALWNISRVLPSLERSANSWQRNFHSAEGVAQDKKLAISNKRG